MVIVLPNGSTTVNSGSWFDAGLRLHFINESPSSAGFVATADHDFDAALLREPGIDRQEPAKAGYSSFAEKISADE